MSQIDVLLKEASAKRAKGDEIEAEEKLDEAVLLAKKEAEGSTGKSKAEKLLKLADVYLAKVNSEYFAKAVYATEAVVAIRSALASYKDVKDASGQAKALCKLGDIHLKKSHLKAAKEDVEQALALELDAEAKKAAMELKVKVMAMEAGGIPDNAVNQVTKAEEAWALAKGEGVAKDVALTAVVNAYYVMGDPSVGLEIAEAEYKAVEQDNDTKGMAEIACALMQAFANGGDNESALRLGASSLTLYRQLADKRGEAACLNLCGQLLLLQDQPMEALPRARSAMALYSEIGDIEGEAKARKVLSAALAGAGQADEAPTRLECQKRLGLLQRAIQERKPVEYQVLMDELVDLGGVSQEDFDEAIGELMALDADGTLAFLQEQEGQDPTQGKGDKAVHHIIEYRYLNFLAGGLGYGPRFRVSKQAYGHYPSSANKSIAMGVADVNEEVYDDWERSVLMHPGMIDCALHIGMASNLVRK